MVKLLGISLGVNNHDKYKEFFDEINLWATAVSLDTIPPNKN